MAIRKIFGFFPQNIPKTAPLIDLKIIFSLTPCQEVGQITTSVAICVCADYEQLTKSDLKSGQTWKSSPKSKVCGVAFS